MRINSQKSNNLMRDARWGIQYEMRGNQCCTSSSFRDMVCCVVPVASHFCPISCHSRYAWLGGIEVKGCMQYYYREDGPQCSASRAINFISGLIEKLQFLCLCVNITIVTNSNSLYHFIAIVAKVTNWYDKCSIEVLYCVMIVNPSLPAEFTLITIQ